MTVPILIAPARRRRRRRKSYVRDRRARALSRKERCPQASSVEHRDAIDARAARGARDPRLHGHRLRPDLRRREAPQARSAASCADPAQRAYINTAVCEGCGDCSDAEQLHGDRAARNRIRPQARDQPDQRATRISPASKGFCPCFVTVRAARCRKHAGAKLPRDRAVAAPPEPRAARAATYNVASPASAAPACITVGHLIGMAAHLDGIGGRCST